MGLRLLGVSFLLFAFQAQANVTDKDFYSQLPTGSTIKFKQGELSIPPHTTSIPIGEHWQDDDGDGVYNFIDWCPETPKGAEVWEKSDFEKGKCSARHIGCSGTKEKWIYDSRQPRKSPTGSVLRCEMLILRSGDDRVLPKDTVLTVVDRADPFLTEAERSFLLKRRSAGGVYFESTVLRTPGGGTHVGISCKSENFTYQAQGRESVVPDGNGRLKRVFEPNGAYKIAHGGYSLPTIGEIKRFMDVTIAKPVPLPR